MFTQRDTDKEKSDLLDFSYGIIYDPSGSGSGAANTPPKMTVQIQLHSTQSRDALEDVLLSKLVNLAMHDGVYYGIATGVLFNYLTVIAIDDQGNVFVANTNNNAVRVIRPGGFTETIGNFNYKHGI